VHGETGSSPASPGGCTTRGSGAARVQLPHEAGVRVSDLPRPKTISLKTYTCQKCRDKFTADAGSEFIINQICPDCWANMKHYQKHDYNFIRKCQEQRKKEIEALGKLIKIISEEVKK